VNSKLEGDADTDAGLPYDAYAEDLSPEALKAICEACTEFQESREWVGAVTAGCTDDGEGGHDFWLTRNGHGAGFWDGDWPEPHAAALTNLAHAFGEVNPYWDDEEKTIEFG
jgi:hypothetical protein